MAVNATIYPVPVAGAPPAGFAYTQGMVIG